MNTDRDAHFDVVVVGAGLAGLSAAVELSAADKKVLVLDKAAAIGGRASTRVANGVCWNVGPHALYSDGAAARAMAEFGVRYSGGKPPVSGGYAVREGAKHALPGGFVSLLTTSLLSAPGKVELGRLLAGFARLDPSRFATMTVEEWLNTRTRDVVVREFLGALFRLSTYANAESIASADVAIVQLQSALAHGVVYVDGGWETLTRGLAEVARRNGARIETQAAVRAVDSNADFRIVKLDDGTRIRCDALVLAVGPRTVKALVAGRSSLAARWSAQRTPIRAACLDLALTSLPRPRATFALGVDRPLYLSVHSAAAKLAPGDTAVVHVMKYLSGAEAAECADTETELEGLLDLIQPGWRERVADRRFLPNMTVAEDVPVASRGGLAGRPDERLDDCPGTFVAGDWVGPQGVLADAAVASARRAARLCVDDLEGRTRASAA